MQPKDIKNSIKKHTFSLAIFPWLIYALYLVFFASHQFESESKLIVKSTEGGSSFDPTSMLASSLTGVGSANDSQIIESYIKSQNMLTFLENELSLSEHYSTSDADWFSRLPVAHTRLELFNYYLDHISVEVDSSSYVITLVTRGFSAEFSQTINKTIVRQAENFLNEINNDLAKSKMDFARGEHEIVENKLQAAKNDLLQFQSKYNVLDPSAEGAATQQIALSLQATLAQKRAELNTLSTMMSDSAPEIINLKRQLKALQKQMQVEKQALNKENSEGEISVTEQIAQFSNLQVQLQLAIQAFSSSLISLENARVETYQKLQHLVTVESPTFPDESTHPNIIYNLTLFAVILLVLYGSGRIIIATIREL